MAKIFGWHWKRVGKKVREAAVNCGGMGLSWGDDKQYVVVVEARTDEDPREERLRIELSPRAARGLAEQLLEWAEKADGERKTLVHVLAEGSEP